MIKSSKIINDPIYGFIRLPKGIIFDLIEHPYFQRLRRISQLGLSNLVYPGANHTRFHHAIGATHLMTKALDILKSKGHEISEEEYEASTIAILLHDIGHGPFSHALEHSLAHEISHEELSIIMMQKLNDEFSGALELAIKIFENKYHKKFLHQLVSSQLDMDRMDYLKRDSFYSGVQEGVIGTERIIHMLNVIEDQLVIENKGIYSIEKFLVARRLMYWQVYLHKTVVAAEQMLINTLKRAKELAQNSQELYSTNALSFFLKRKITLEDFIDNDKVFESFINLDDNDIMSSIKEWKNHPDFVLSSLSSRILNRNLLKTILSDKPLDQAIIDQIKTKTKQKYSLDNKEVNYLFYEGIISNEIYNVNKTNIKILLKNGTLKNLSEASDHPIFSSNESEVNKFYYCHLEDCR